MMLLARRLVAMLAGCCLMLSGCAQIEKVPEMLGIGDGNLTVDPADPCASQRTAFNGSRSFFTKEIVIKTATGALLGAAAGAAAGGAANGNQGATAGAVIGAIGGAAAGFMSGYYDRLKQSHLDGAMLAQQVNRDVTTESQQIDHTAATFAALRSCRFNQAASIKNREKRGLIARSEARARLDQERAWFAQEVTVARDAGVNMKSRDDQFTYAAQSLPKARAQQAEAVATETIPQKRNSFENSVGNAESQSKVAFALDSSGQTWLWAVLGYG